MSLLPLCNSHNFKWNWNGNNMWISMAITLFFFCVRLFIRVFVYLCFQWATIHLVFWDAFGNLSAACAMRVCVYFPIHAFFTDSRGNRRTFLSMAWNIIRKQYTQIFWLFNVLNFFFFSLFSLIFDCIFVCLFVRFFACVCVFLFIKCFPNRRMYVCVLAHEVFFVFAKMYNRGKE